MIEKKQAFFENARLMSEEVLYKRVTGLQRASVIIIPLFWEIPNITQKRVIFLQVNTILNRRLTWKMNFLWLLS